jgi:hypothetical protein
MIMLTSLITPTTNSPFQAAGRGLALPLSASYAELQVTKQWPAEPWQLVLESTLSPPSTTKSLSLSLVIPPYASPSTSHPVPVLGLGIPHLSIIAPSAFPLTTVPIPVQGTELSQSPLIANYFADVLAACGITSLYPNLAHKLCYGFDISKKMPTLLDTYIPKNHAWSNEDLLIIEWYYDEEIQLGRMVGPMSVEEATAFVSGHFVMLPIGLVPKPDSEKMCIICNMSFRYIDSTLINGHIDKADYTCRWMTSQMFDSWVCTISSMIPMFFCISSLCLGFPYLHDAVDGHQDDVHRYLLSKMWQKAITVMCTDTCLAEYSRRQSQWCAQLPA